MTKSCTVSGWWTTVATGWAGKDLGPVADSQSLGFEGPGVGGFGRQSCVGGQGCSGCQELVEYREGGVRRLGRDGLVGGFSLYGTA